MGYPAVQALGIWSRVTMTRIRIGLLLIFGGALSLLLGWAWINGGRTPLREIVEPVAVPEVAR